MDLIETLALVVFIATYLLIAVHKTPWFEIKRSYSALIGALLMMIIGALTLQQAFDSIDFDVLFLLLGMMTLVAGLEYFGFFTLISDYLVKKCTAGFKLLLMIMLFSAVLSAIALNDAVVLMFTPIVIKCCMKMKINPIPYLIGLMMSANIGSIATAVGNPQNAYIVSLTGIDFGQYSLYCIPIAIVCLVIAYAILALIFRRSLFEQHDFNVGLTDEQRNIQKRPLIAMIILTIVCFLGFILTGYFDVKLYQISLLAGAASLIMVLIAKPADGVWVIKRIDWNILLFFIGLFVLIGGAVHTGIISDIASLFPGFRDGETPDVLGLSVFSVILSNLVSNVPAVMMIAEMMPNADFSLWITLAASSTLAGNTTLIGSAANIIVAERADKYGVKINFLKFMLVGIVVTVATVAAMIIMIELMF